MVYAISARREILNKQNIVIKIIKIRINMLITIYRKKQNRINNFINLFLLNCVPEQEKLKIVFALKFCLFDRVFI